MRRMAFRWTRVRTAIALALVAGLSACGGGGGGDEPRPPAPTPINLTPANVEPASHAVAAGAVAMGATSSVPIGRSAGPASGATRPLALGTLGMVADPSAPHGVLALLKRALHEDRAVRLSARERPLALIVLPPEPCTVSGNVTISFDDRDNSGTLGVGDVLAIAFNACKDDASEVVNGSVTAQLNAIGPTSMTMRMTLAQLTTEATDGRHSVSMTGTVLTDFVQPNPSSERVLLTIEGEAALGVRTHQYTDSVTLQSGYAQQWSYDYAAGSTTTTLTGSLSSTAAGGLMTVTTDTPFYQLDADANPRSGVVRVTGATGVMLLRALSPSNVSIELDANNDGTFEWVQTRTWDWLF